MNEFRESSVDLSLRLVHLARARLKAGTAAVTRCWVGGHFAQATLRAGARLQPIIDQPRVTCWLYRPIYHRTHTHTHRVTERDADEETDQQTDRHADMANCISIRPVTCRFASFPAFNTDASAVKMHSDGAHRICTLHRELINTVVIITTVVNLGAPHTWNENKNSWTIELTCTVQAAMNLALS